MKYDIYFHNDFDGRACAALILSFLRSRGDDIEHFVPVAYDLLSQWKDENFFKKHKLFKGTRNPAIVVDFLYHPKAAFWFDHHPTTFKKDSWEKKFKQTKSHRLDTHYFSCCHLVYDALKNGFGWKPPRHFVELVKWLDIIDAARFKSAKQAVVMKEPALRIEAFIYETESEGVSKKWLVTMLAEKPIDRIVRLPAVKKRIDAFLKENARGTAFFKKHVEPFSTGTFVDLTKSKNRPPKFIAEYLFPKLRYRVRIMTKEGLYHVGVASNPWLPFNPKMNIGDLLKVYGGGGHKRVGGVEFKTKKEAERAAREMIAYLEVR